MLGGIETALGQTMLGCASASGEVGSSTIVGRREKFGAATAALINGTTANALDFDETLLGIGHPSATVISSALAVGELKRSSGKEFLNSILVGYDVGNRIGKAIQPSFERLQQVWNVGTWQTLGAAAAAARLCELDLPNTRRAYGIAGATAPLPNTQKWGFPAEERPVHWVKEPTGWASWTGTQAALLAESGFVGNQYILDGPKGFWIMAGSDQCDFDAMTDALGEYFSVMELSIKPYSCCRWQHAALDCVARILTENGIVADQVKSIDIHTFHWVADFDEYEPKDMVDAQFSMPYSATMMAHGIPSGPKWFRPENLRNAELLAYSRRVQTHVDPEMNRIFHEEGNVCARVEILTQDGQAFTETSRTPSGSPELFPEESQVFEKFLGLARPVLGECSNQLLDRILRIEDVEDVSEITRLTRPDV